MPANGKNGNGKPDEPEYVAVCFVCGLPLTKEQVSSTFRGEVIHWNERFISDPGDFVVLYMCEGCRVMCKENAKGGVQRAKERLNRMQSTLTIANPTSLPENDPCGGMSCDDCNDGSCDGRNPRTGQPIKRRPYLDGDTGKDLKGGTRQ